MGKIKFGSTVWGLPGHGLFAPYLAKKAGLDGLQLELGSYEFGYALAQKGVQEAYLEEKDKYQLEYPSIVLNDLMKHGYAKGCNTEDGKIAFDMMELSLDVADEMQIDSIMIPNFGENRLREPVHIENTITALKFVCEKAQKKGITVMTENPLSWDQQIKLLEAVGADNLKIHYDSQNMKYNWDLDPCEQLEKLYPYMAKQLHVKDGNAKPDPAGSKPLGMGNTDFYRQMELLKKFDYDGWIITENYYCQSSIRDDSIRDSQWSVFMKDMESLKAIFE